MQFLSVVNESLKQNLQEGYKVPFTDAHTAIGKASTKLSESPITPVLSRLLLE
ncbi:hypothetical protein Bca101_067023 [Brassica carinata]